jgi:hypothetical protein
MSGVGSTVSIAARFNGPQRSGNGGYAAGALAAFVGEPAEVSLRSPVPLDTELQVVSEEDGSMRMLDGETLVCEGRAAEALDLDVPEPVSVDEAREAMSRYRGLIDGEFCRCFVCGRARADSFEVFAGRVDGRELVASTWTPPAWAEADEGRVRTELIWAVLDCPTYFASHMEGELSAAMLARMTAEVVAPVATGVEHVVIGWPIEIDGRKHHAGSALFSADGKLLASARALMIEPRQS